jgi:acyl-CoA thioesterase-1
MLRSLLLLAGLTVCFAGCDRPAAPTDEAPAPVSTETDGLGSGEGVAEGSTPTCTAPASEGADDVVTVLFFGDSLTAGYGLADPSSEAYPALVEAEAREAGLPVRVVNAGVSGETTAGGLRRVAWTLGSEPDVDVFVLALGGNDGLRGLDPSAMQSNLGDILDCVHSAHPEARLVVAGMEAPPNLGTDYTARFRAVFPAVAAQFSATVVPFLLDGVGGVARLNQSDGIHPTAEGQRRVAENIWQALAPVLQQEARR